MGFSIISIGEVLWDLLPSGPQLGGAPANFAYQAQALGSKAQVLTRIGNDSRGEELLARYKQINMSTDSVQIDDHLPTGTVSVSLTDRGIPNYHFPESVAWDHIEVTPAAIQLARHAHAICFGTLAQRHPNSQSTIQQLIEATSHRTLRIFDVNLRQNFYNRGVIAQSLQLANVLKLNDEELAVLQDMFVLPGDYREQICALSGVFDLYTVVLTCGAQGSFVYHRGVWSEQKPKKIKVIDTVGAGDAFTAGLTVGLLSGIPLGEVHSLAEEMASSVCGQVGGMG